MARGSLRRLDWPLLIVTVLLVGTGLIVLQSINLKNAALTQGFNPSKQILFSVVGFGALVAMARIDYRLWFRLAAGWYGLGVMLLLFVLIAGHTAQGAKRWIDIGPLQFQPSEFIKLGIIMILARLFSAKHDFLPRLRFLFLALIYLAVPAFFIIIQPDLGSGLVLGFIWGVMILGSNISKWHLAGLAAVGLVILPLIFTRLQPYQVRRIETFANPSLDPQGAGYNVLQSTIAVGSGRLFGRGLSSGSQSQLNFLPSQQTDFIFATLAEKLGFVGAALVLVMFTVLLIRAIVIAWHADDRFGMLLALGITAYFMFHITINIGMNLGIMPVTGIPLPLLSYGGTSLIISLAAIGLLLSISLHREGLEFQPN